MVSLTKIASRISQSKWTKLYVTLAVLQGVIIIALQAAIASQNTAQAKYVPAPSEFHMGDVFGGTSTTATRDFVRDMNAAAQRLNRIKWENVAFIGFQVWFVGMAIDATVFQNTPEVLALATLNIICGILGGLEVMDGKRWLNRLRNYNAIYGESYDLNIPTTSLQIAFYLEIVLTVLIILFALVFAWVSYLVIREFGWMIYKKIGASVEIQKMYRIFQLFVLILKIDIFIEFLVSLFYLIQSALGAGFEWETWVLLGVTILILPMLYFGRMTVASESHARMVLFIFFQFVVVFELILMLRDTLQTDNDYWYVWICFVVIGIVFALATAVLGAWCMHNFDKGLAPYVVRGSQKKELQEQNELRQPSLHSWHIDED